jgi:hypothetical protein
MKTALRILAAAVVCLATGASQAAQSIAIISTTEAAILASVSPAAFGAICGGSRANLYPAIKSLTHYASNPIEAQTMFALCQTGRVAVSRAQVCDNATEAVVADVLRTLTSRGLLNACPIAVC